MPERENKRPVTQEDLHFNIELPSTVADATIPVTRGCNVSFSVNQIVAADNGEQFPVIFQDGDTVYMVMETSRTTTLRIDATTDANTASFLIPASIADDCRTAFSSFQIIKFHSGIESPLLVGGFQRFDGT